MSVQQEGDRISKLHLLALPTEIIQQIVSEVRPSDIENLQLTCRGMSDLAQKWSLSHRRSKIRYASLGSMNVRRIHQMVEKLSDDPSQNYYPRSFQVSDLNGRCRAPFSAFIPQLESVLDSSLDDFSIQRPSNRGLNDYSAPQLRELGLVTSDIRQPRTTTELIENLGLSQFRALSALLVIMLPNVQEFVSKESDRWSLEQLARVLDFSSNSVKLGLSNRLLGQNLTGIHLAAFDFVNLPSLLRLPVLKTLQIKYLYVSSLPGRPINRSPTWTQTHIETLKIGEFEGSSEQLAPMLRQLKCLRTFGYCKSDCRLMDFDSIILALHVSSKETLRELSLTRRSSVLFRKRPCFTAGTRIALSQLHQLQSLTLPIWYFLPGCYGGLNMEHEPHPVTQGSNVRLFFPISSGIPASVKQLTLTETAYIERLDGLIESLVTDRDQGPLQFLELVLLEFPRAPRYLTSGITGRRPLIKDYGLEKICYTEWKTLCWGVRVMLRSTFDLEPVRTNASPLTYESSRHGRDIVRHWYTQAGRIQFPHKQS